MSRSLDDVRTSVLGGGATYAEVLEAASKATQEDIPAVLDLARLLDSAVEQDAVLDELKRSTGAKLSALRKDLHANDEDGMEHGFGAATRLAQIARDLYDEFGISTEGEHFAVPRSGPRLPLLTRGGYKSLRRALARAYYEEQGRVAPQHALTDALGTIEGWCQEAEPTQLHLRYAKDNNGTWIDMGDDTGRAVLVNSTGWKVEDSPW